MLGGPFDLAPVIRYVPASANQATAADIVQSLFLQDEVVVCFGASSANMRKTLSPVRDLAANRVDVLKPRY